MAAESPDNKEIADNREVQPPSGAEQSNTTPSPQQKQGAPLQRAIEKMADRAPRELLEMTATFGMAGMMGNPLHQKMDGAHITKVLDLAEKHEQNEHELKKQDQRNAASEGKWDRSLHLIYFVIFVALVIFVIEIFKGQPNILSPILSAVGAGVTGFLAGRGWAMSKQDKKNSD